MHDFFPISPLRGEECGVGLSPVQYYILLLRFIPPSAEKKRANYSPLSLSLLYTMGFPRKKRRRKLYEQNPPHTSCEGGWHITRLIQYSLNHFFWKYSIFPWVMLFFFVRESPVLCAVGPLYPPPGALKEKGERKEGLGKLPLVCVRGGEI